MTARLAWQSRTVLFAVLLPVSVLLAWHFGLHEASAWDRVETVALSIGIGAGIAAFASHSATAPAAVTGGILTSAMLLGSTRAEATAWIDTPLPPLLLLILLTVASTRFRRDHKRNPQRTGRDAAQVTANLGAAALVAMLPLAAGLLDSAGAGVSAGLSQLWRSAGTVMLAAALAEAAADTMSSELGEVLGGEPYLITNGRIVVRGTDGAVSAAGTLAGVFGALAVTASALPMIGWNLNLAWRAAAGAIGGLFVDSLLGATLEARGYLNNDAVNFLSTVAAALIALALTW